LASVGIFIVDEGGMIGHSRLSLLLRTDSVPSLRHAARFFAGGSSWNAWGALDKAMHGAVPFESVFGVKYFDYLTAHPDEGQLFNQVMATTAYADRHGAVADAYNFSNASLIADIGGGNGALLRAILPQYP
jgi:O-methyltransferase